MGLAGLGALETIQNGTLRVVENQKVLWLAQLDYVYDKNRQGEKRFCVPLVETAMQNRGGLLVLCYCFETIQSILECPCCAFVVETLIHNSIIRKKIAKWVLP